jgi:hypothetical protein
MRAGVLLAVIAACAPSKPTGSCLFWSDCGEGGACELGTPHGDQPLRFECSFPDEGCPSGRRYGEFAQPAVANECVEPYAGLGGLCTASDDCDPHLQCELGRCVSTVQLDGTAQLFVATCSNAKAQGGDVYFWGIALQFGTGLILPGVIADAAPPSGGPAAAIEGRSASAGANHLCMTGLDPTSGAAVSECLGRLNDPAVGGGALGTWAFTTPLGPHRRVAAGVGHSCGMRETAIDCWGDNSALQLDGLDGSPSTLATTELAQTVTGVTAGRAFTCAGTTSDVWCWGAETNWTPETFDGPRGSVARVLGLGAGEVTAIDAGDSHACAIKGGLLWCWGANDAGQSSGEPSAIPVAPAQPLGDTPVLAVAAGKQHTCAITAERAVLCWGSNVQGQLGSSGAGSAPRVVALDARPTGPLAAADDATCAVLEDSFVHCWGAPGLTSDAMIGVAGEVPITLERFVLCTL